MDKPEVVNVFSAVAVTLSNSFDETRAMDVYEIVKRRCSKYGDEDSDSKESMQTVFCMQDGHWNVYLGRICLMKVLVRILERNLLLDSLDVFKDYMCVHIFLLSEGFRWY
jgi:hypothetical protein